MRIAVVGHRILPWPLASRRGSCSCGADADALTGVGLVVDGSVTQELVFFSLANDLHDFGLALVWLASGLSDVLKRLPNPGPTTS